MEFGAAFLTFSVAEGARRWSVAPLSQRFPLPKARVDGVWRRFPNVFRCRRRASMECGAPFLTFSVAEGARRWSVSPVS